MPKSTSDDQPNQDPGNEGRKARDNALNLFEKHRRGIVSQMRHAALDVAIRTGKVTADDWHTAVEIPPAMDPRCCGSVPTVLANAGILKTCGFSNSNRKDRHAGTNRVWRLESEAKALQWLKDNPLPPDNHPAPAHQQRSLFDDEDMKGCNSHA